MCASNTTVSAERMYRQWYCFHPSICTEKGVTWFLSLIPLTMTTFDAPEEKFRSYYGKRRKCWLQAFSSFPRMFSILQKKTAKSANAFILNNS